MAKKPTEESQVATESETEGEFAISIPYVLAGEGYRARHLDIQLDNDQAEAARYLFDALDHDGKRLANGRRVGSGADAVRWLLEQVAEKMPR